MGRKSKGGKEKDRTDWAYGIVNAENGQISVRYHPETESIEIVGAEPGSTRTERSYERASGKPKVVSSVPSNGISSFTADQALFKFKWIVAVDTNCRIIGGKRCGFTYACYVPNALDSYADAVPFETLGGFLTIGLKDGVSAEALGWQLLIKHFLFQYNPGRGPLALVVDSELGRHKAINARQEPVYGDALLPEGMSLIYASADVDKETLQGQMIRACDKAATSTADDFTTRGELPDLRHANGDGNFEGYAIFQLPTDQER